MIVNRFQSRGEIVNLSPDSFPAISAKILAEKRRTERVKAAFSAAILVNGEFVCHCIVKDVSTSGLKLQLEKMHKLPNEFTLKLSSLKSPIVVSQQWKSGKMIGVRSVEGTTQGNDFL